jgi:hypothetical protein
MEAIPELEMGRKLSFLTGIQPEKFQSILTIPYFNLGSDQFWREPEGFILQKVLLMSAKTGLPTNSAMLTRTSRKQTINQMQWVSEPYKYPLLLKSLVDKRPFLLMVDKSNLDNERGKPYAHLLNYASILHDEDRMALYLLPYNSFEKSVLDKVKEANILMSSKLKSNSKSYSSDDDVEFLKTITRGPHKGEITIDGEWKEYMYDIAFQKYVVQKANPTKTVITYIVLADKTKSATVEGLNQIFKIKREQKRIEIEIKPGITKKDLGEIPLKVVNVDDVCTHIYANYVNIDLAHPKGEAWNFEDLVYYLSDKYNANERIWTNKVGSKCKTCQYVNKGYPQGDTKSGLHECWKKITQLSDTELAQPLVLESYKSPVETFETNVMGTVNVLDASIKGNHIKSVICVTTDKVYKNLEIEKYYKETDELGGLDPYSASKSAIDIAVQSWMNTLSKFPISIVW